MTMIYEKSDIRVHSTLEDKIYISPNFISIAFKCLELFCQLPSLYISNNID